MYSLVPYRYAGDIWYGGLYGGELVLSNFISWSTPREGGSPSGSSSTNTVLYFSINLVSVVFCSCLSLPFLLTLRWLIFCTINISIFCVFFRNNDLKFLTPMLLISNFPEFLSWAFGNVHHWRLPPCFCNLYLGCFAHAKACLAERGI